MLTYARYAALFEIARALPASPMLAYPRAVERARRGLRRSGVLSSARIDRLSADLPKYRF